MRAEKNNPEQVYSDFGDWVFTGLNAVWLMSLVFAYLYYLLTTEEV